MVDSKLSPKCLVWEGCFYTRLTPALLIGRNQKMTFTHLSVIGQWRCCLTTGRTNFIAKLTFNLSVSVTLALDFYCNVAISIKH